MKNSEISKLITKEIISIWQAVNPQLSSLKEYYIGQEVDTFSFKKFRQINRKTLTAHKVKRIEEQLDRLFEVSSCCYKLSQDVMTLL